MSAILFTGLRIKFVCSWSFRKSLLRHEERRHLRKNIDIKVENIMFWGTIVMVIEWFIGFDSFISWALLIIHQRSCSLFSYPPVEFTGINFVWILQVRTRAVTLPCYICSSEDILKHAKKLLKAELPVSLRLIGRMAKYNFSFFFRNLSCPKSSESSFQFPKMRIIFFCLWLFRLITWSMLAWWCPLT